LQTDKQDRHANKGKTLLINGLTKLQIQLRLYAVSASGYFYTSIATKFCVWLSFSDNNKKNPI